MPTYQEYQAQIAELHALAEQARQGEIAEARKQVQELIKQYGLDPQELLIEKKRTPGAKKADSVKAKYRDPKTGATWTGRGRAPRWLEGRDKEDFLIK